jgi:N-acylneuraminate cytidylyltransferase
MKAHSERLPGKNMRPLNDRPLFHWIMDALNDSGVVSEIIINTDSEEIAENAKEHFDVTIHMRPKYLLNIQSDEPNQIMAYDLEKIKGEYFIQSHCTNPLLKPETIKLAVNTFFGIKDKFDSLFSVTPLSKRLYNENYKAINHDPNKLIKTQDLLPVFEENCCIYIFSRNSFKKNNNRIGENPYFFSIDKFESVDIDEEFEFFIAEKLIKRRNGN